MSSPAQPPTRVPWPPLIYLMAMGLGVAAGIVYPVGWIEGPLADILFAAGCVMVTAVVAIYVSAIRALSRAKTTISPSKVADRLVVDGPYAFSRNPLYLANTILMIAIGLIVGSLWFPALAVLASFATSLLAIGPEERHLKARFGKRYLDYAKRVRRWV